MRKIITFLKDPCNFYITIAFMYRFQGTLFPAAGIISRSFLLLTFLLSIYYTFKVNRTCRLNTYMKGLNLLVLFFTVTGIFYLLFDNDVNDANLHLSRYTYLVNNLTSLLPVYPLYLFCIQGKLTKEKLAKWFWPFLVCVICRFYYELQVALDKMMDYTGGDVEETTNNGGYIVCSLLPLVFFINKNKLLQYTSLTVLLIFVVMAMKRGAILIALLCVVWFLLRNKDDIKRINKGYLTMLACGAFGAVYKVVDYMLNNSAFFQMRIENTLEGKTSGRDDLYGTALNIFLEKFGLTDFLFGMGPNSTYTLIGNRAHNDWLELALNHGLLGITIYFIYWVGLFSIWRKCRHDHLVFSALGMFILIFFLKTFISMSYDAMELYSSAVLAWCMAQYDFKYRRINIRR